MAAKLQRGYCRSAGDTAGCRIYEDTTAQSGQTGAV